MTEKPATEHPKATATEQVDNDRVRVTRWHFEPGQATGYHRHDYDYVVVPTIGGKLAMTGPAGGTEAELRVGVSYYRPAGVEHDVLNVDDHAVEFVEIEFKTGA